MVPGAGDASGAGGCQATHQDGITDVETPVLSCRTRSSFFSPTQRSSVVHGRLCSTIRPWAAVRPKASCVLMPKGTSAQSRSKEPGAAVPGVAGGSFPGRGFPDRRIKARRE